MIRRLIILAVIIMIVTTIRSENAFDLNSGRIRVKIAVLGITVYNQIKETPLSQLKSQLLPNATAEPDWYTLNSKSLVNRTEQSFPIGELLKVAIMINNNEFSPAQKTTIIQQVWNSLKNKDYQTITTIQQQLEKRSAMPVASPNN